MAVSGMGLSIMFRARADKFKPVPRGKARSSRRTGPEEIVWIGMN
tara:strand:+ start:379 stop:513 length:135 start_codon:yes stop_codon:yes gene_type:complete